MEQSISILITRNDLDSLLGLLLRFSYLGLSLEDRHSLTQAIPTLQKWVGMQKNGNLQLTLSTKSTEV